MYQIIINPIIVNNKPVILKFFKGIFSINLDIFLIFDGNKAQRRPSIKNTKPMAITNSFMPWFLLFSFNDSGFAEKLKEITIRR